MCVAYRTVAPRSSLSLTIHCNKSCRTQTSKLVVISSSNKILNGLTKPNMICTRRRCPSESWCMCQFRSIPSMRTNSSRRSGYEFWSRSWQKQKVSKRKKRWIQNNVGMGQKFESCRKTRLAKKQKKTVRTQVHFTNPLKKITTHQNQQA